MLRIFRVQRLDNNYNNFFHVLDVYKNVRVSQPVSSLQHQDYSARFLVMWNSYAFVHYATMDEGKLI